MKISVIICDRCEIQQKDEKFHKLSFFKENRSDGLERQDWNWVADLCPDCTSKLATRLTTFLLGSNDLVAKTAIAKDFHCREE